MIFLTHFTFALLVALGILRITSFQMPSFLFLCIVSVSALLPDIDTATSFIGSKIKPISFFLSHRKFFHSIVCAIIAASLVFNLTQNSEYALAFMIGYGSHLFLDAFTRGGTALFWPAKLMVKGPFKTRGLFDMLLFIMSNAAIFLLIKP
jgi:membrane-bound metal-dependent hydrolase YbcI (DUF457 family)